MRNHRVRGRSKELTLQIRLTSLENIRVIVNIVYSIILIILKTVS